MQRDPAGYADGLNLYAYVGNNPVLFVDPSGLMSELSDSVMDIDINSDLNLNLWNFGVSANNTGSFNFAQSHNSGGAYSDQHRTIITVNSGVTGVEAVTPPSMGTIPIEQNISFDQTYTDIVLQEELFGLEFSIEATTNGESGVKSSVGQNVVSFLANPWVNNSLAAVGGILQVAGGLGVVAVCGWTGIGAVAGVTIGVQGAVSAGVGIGNLLNLAMGVEPMVDNSGLVSATTSIVTDNVTARNIATATDLGINLIAGGIGVNQVNKTVTAAMESDMLVMRMIELNYTGTLTMYDDLGVQGSSMLSNFFTITGTASTTAASITAEINKNY